MTLNSASLFFTLLALAANALVVAVLLSGRLRHHPRVGYVMRAFRAELLRDALPLAWLIATVATAGSLYLSEMAGLPPCNLCWYQRIAMYPLPVVLCTAIILRDRSVWRYVLPVSVVGGAIAVYHYTLEWFPSVDVGACTVDVPCTVVWFRRLGFASIPYLALSAFVAVAVLMLFVAMEGRRNGSTPDQDPQEALPLRPAGGDAGRHRGAAGGGAAADGAQRADHPGDRTRDGVGAGAPRRR